MQTNIPDEINSNISSFHNCNLSSEIIWNTKRNYNNQIGFKLFYGLTPGLKNSYNKVEDDNKRVGNMSVFFKIDKLSGIFDIGGVEV